MDKLGYPTFAKLLPAQSLVLPRSAGVVIILLVGSCSGEQGPTPPSTPVVATVSIEPSAISLLPQETRQLSATARSAAGQSVSGSLLWSTNAPNVATVSQAGIVTAVAPGQAVITAAMGGKSGTAMVTVAVPTATLTLVVGSGVVSTLPTGITNYPHGTQLPYSFGARPGYETPAAQLDGNPVPLSGTVTVDRDMALVVMADSIIILPTEDQPLAERLQAFRTTSDPAAAWQALQAELAQLYQTVGPTDARQRLLRAMAVTLDPVADAAPLWQAMQAGLDAAAPAPTTGAPLGVPVTPCPDLPIIEDGVEVAFIYVNGISTDFSEACTTAAKHLRPILINAGFGAPIAYPVGVSLNTSMTESEPSSLSGVLCLTVSALKVAFGKESTWNTIQNCLGASGLGTFADLIEALWQVHSRLPPLEDSERLADVAEAIWMRGGRVVLVAHSQGNLLAREAIDILRGRVPQSAMACIGVASIAPPITLVRAAPEPPVRDMIIEGTGVLWGLGRSKDFLLLVQPPLVPPNSLAGTVKVATTRSDWWDRALAMATLIPAAKQIAPWAAGIVLHGVNDSYLASDATVARLKSMVTAQVTAVTTGCPAPPGAATIALNPTSVEFNAAAGATLPAPRTVDITNSGGGSLNGLSVSSIVYSFSPGQFTGWLGTPTLSGTTAPATITLRPNTTNLPAGVYSASVMISAAGSVSNSPATVNVTYTVGSGTPGTALALGTATHVLPFGQVTYYRTLHVVGLAFSGSDVTIGALRKAGAPSVPSGTLSRADYPLINSLAVCPSGEVYAAHPFGAGGTGGAFLWRVDPTSGVLTSVGALPTQLDYVQSLACGDNNILFAGTDWLGVGIGGDLFIVNRSTAHAVQVNPVTIRPSFLALGSLQGDLLAGVTPVPFSGSERLLFVTQEGGSINFGPTLSQSGIRQLFGAGNEIFGIQSNGLTQPANLVRVVESGLVEIVRGLPFAR